MIDGYKDSIFGVLPYDWEVLSLSEITKVYDGTHQTPKYVESGIPFYSVEHVTSNDFSKTKFITEEVFLKENKRVELEKGDILMTRIGDVGTAKYIDWDVNASFYVSLALIKQQPSINGNFLAQFIKGHLFQKELYKRIIHTAFPKKINLGELGKCHVALPPLPEQQKIAEILSTVDDKIDVIDQQIKETSELKKGLMQRLLTKGIGHTEFKDSPLGEIPESWEVVQLVNHINLLSGYAFKSDGFNEEGLGTKLLRGINITTGRLRWNKKLDRWWNLPFDDFNKYYAQIGDLVISMDGSLVGRNYARVKEDDLPLLIVQRVASLRAKESLDLEYLNQIIGSPLWLNYVDAVKTSSGIPHISSKNIKEFRIAFPPIKEQEQIAEILSKIDEKLEVMADKRINYQDLKKGLMQQLLTGKIRVNSLLKPVSTS